MFARPRIGLIQVYTGEGKGKTTAALGLAVRAAGYGMKIAFIQFLKGRPSGEHNFLAKYPMFAFFKGATLDSFIAPPEQLRQESAGMLDLAEEKMLSDQFDLMILDEINVVVSKGYIGIARMLEFLDKKPAGTELVLTGRGAPQEIIQKAGLVTEMSLIKHPYQKGIGSRKGIEY